MARPLIFSLLFSLEGALLFAIANSPYLLGAGQLIIRCCAHVEGQKQYCSCEAERSISSIAGRVFLWFAVGMGRERPPGAVRRTGAQAEPWTARPPAQILRLVDLPPAPVEICHVRKPLWQVGFAIVKRPVPLSCIWSKKRPHRNSEVFFMGIMAQL